MGFEEVIADFPLQHINSKASGVPYSPWHFLEHMRIAQWDILEFIRNPDHVSPDYPAGYRPRAGEKADAARWHETIGDFEADLKALQAMVADPETDLYAPIPHAPDYTIFREILVAADGVVEISLSRSRCAADGVVGQVTFRIDPHLVKSPIDIVSM